MNLRISSLPLLALLSFTYRRFDPAVPGPDIRRDSAVLFNLLRAIVGKKKVGLRARGILYFPYRRIFQRFVLPVRVCYSVDTRSQVYLTLAQNV